MNKEIIIDCDPGIDDALAIALLAKSGKLDIRAITTVAGNCTVQEATNNARYVLDQLKVSAPVYSGAEKPIRKELVTANVHGEGGLAGIITEENQILTGDAPDIIAEIISKNPGNVAILAIGPLTNIAILLQKYPDMEKQIGELVIMGGAFDVGGNKTAFAEYNFFVDPDAAKIVLESEVKKTIIPLDVCYQTGFKISDLKPSEEFVQTILNFYKDSLRRFEKLESIVVYDAAAAYFLLSPMAFKTDTGDVDVVTRGEMNGMTRRSKKAYRTTQVATQIDSSAFLNDFIKILEGGD